ncbi:MAG TPA: exodeoxyribonuclease VII large subunit [Hyphomicrobiaceae bacterium]|nr:exodeoxyribonuclease VII large subunit [Hyphomicrobiaceae bacterium]
MAEPAYHKPPASNAVEFTVSELSNAIKRLLEDGFAHVRLKGEISGFRGPHASGHCYFALKDDKAKIDAVIWRSTFQRLKIRPEEGMEVIAQGRITTYPGSSRYQIVIETLEPAGVGALMALLEERKRKLAAEGLFDEARKKKLPFLPKVVGIVTSPTGAVIRDMLHGFNERFPTHVVVWPVRVQGDGCAEEVAAAIRGFNVIPPGAPVPRPDVLIVARGGGSLEDLWGFNEEIVARAAALSRIPLISAVGHETDWTLIDLVADARAPTPTKAAEWAVPKLSDLVEATRTLGHRARVAIARALAGQRAHFKAASRGLPRLEDLIALPRQRFDAVDRRLPRALLANTRVHAMRHARLSTRLNPRLLTARLERAREQLGRAWHHGERGLARLAARSQSRFDRVAGRFGPQILLHRISRARESLDGCGKLLAALSYQRVLKRGYALVRDEAGRTVRSVSQAPPGTRLSVEVSDGTFPAEALDGGKLTKDRDRDEARTARPERRRTSSPGRSDGSGQGSLF